MRKTEKKKNFMSENNILNIIFNQCLSSRHPGQIKVTITEDLNALVSHSLEMIKKSDGPITSQKTPTLAK